MKIPPMKGRNGGYDMYLFARLPQISMNREKVIAAIPKRILAARTNSNVCMFMSGVWLMQ